jgi:hypothetical protein
MGRPRETDFETMTREQLIFRLMTIRAQWRNRALRKRMNDALKRMELGPKKRGPYKKHVQAILDRYRWERELR